MRIAFNELQILLLVTALSLLVMALYGTDGGTVLLMVVAILTAIYGTYSSTLKHKLYGYIWQSAALVPLAMLRYFATHDGSFLVVTAFLAIRIALIPWLMALATVRKQVSGSVEESLEREQSSWFRALEDRYRRRYRDAQEYWLIYGATRMSAVVSLLANAAFIGIAYFVALRVQVPVPTASAFVGTTALGAAISLLLIGLFAMINETDLPSQIVGLLIMENGLFLAAAVFITRLSLLTSFWVSMITFFFITFAILAKFVPDVHYISESAEIETQKLLAESPPESTASVVEGSDT